MKAGSEIPRAKRWHWRDGHAWHALGASMLALVASGGVLYGYYWWRVVRTAHRAGTEPRRSRHLFLFGKRLVAGAPDADLVARVARLHALLQADASRPAWLLGGRTDDGPSEAAAARDALAALGVPAHARVALEESSAHTLENLRHARALIATAIDEPVALISNRYHLARCAVLAEGLGFRPELCAAEPRLRWNARTLRALSYEALLLMWLDVGRRYARLIRNEAMLDRVR